MLKLLDVIFDPHKIMKIGQTSIVVFFAKLLGAALGFVATLTFAQIVGAEVLGVYALVLTIMKWGTFASDLGFGNATTKRISENNEPGAFLAAGVLWVFAIGFVVSIAILLARPLIETYVSDFDQYITLSIVWFLVTLLFIRLLYQFPHRILSGERKVHLAALLDPVKQGSQSIIQIALVVLGYSLLGMLVGYAIGGIIVGFVSLYFVSLRPVRPKLHHFKSLFDYAKYAWFGKLKSRIFEDIDIIILGIFVPSAAIGVYAVAWSLSRFLELFSNSISSTLFPEISYSSTQESGQIVRGYIEDSLRYTGLIVIPGFVGGLLLSEELMMVYGPEFVDGAVVLWILIFAILIYAYQKQLVNALNGVDRPDLSFRVNVVFATLNAGLNLALIPQYGIEGAAIASVVSVAVALVIAYYYLNDLLDFTLPVGEIGRQVAAAGVMGVLVLLAREVIELTGLLQRNILIALVLVVGGAGVYFLLMLGISAHFRGTVRRNIPERLTDRFA